MIMKLRADAAAEPRQADPKPALPDGFHIRAAAFLPARIAYVRDVIGGQLKLDPRSRQALVVGSGRGLLARELVGLGFIVTERTLGDARPLPFGDGTFDFAYYHDTFETTDELDRVLSEAARVLRPGGALLYDTVNRTRLSRLIYLGALQSWRLTRVMPRDRYAWERFRPPDELAATMTKHGLSNRDVTAFLPASPPRLLRALLRARRGDIEDGELARLAGMHIAEGKRPEVTYLGFAIKTGV
jgi:2-polyprenyl-6-hydroxyphenyl methylase / 3-demethylubiquinone-9 3-methyltransferase